MIDICNALTALGMDNFVVNHDAKTEEEYKNSFRDETGKNRYIEWTDVQAKLAELKAEYKANQYQRDRLAEYPSIQELVVALYDADDKAEIDKKRAEIKKKYPKPE